MASVADSPLLNCKTKQRVNEKNHEDNEDNEDIEDSEVLVKGVTRCPFATMSPVQRGAKQRKPFVLQNLLDGTTMTDTLHQKATGVSH